MSDHRIIDLHAHTTASDGSLTPRELVESAHRVGLSALAIADHDTTAGVPEALAAGLELGVEIVPAVEISALFPGGTMHILGYYCDMDDPGFQENLKAIREGRDNRNPRIVAKLNELGLEITMDEIMAECGGDVLGRPHFARAMLKKGFVQSVQEAFDIYLSSEGKAYMPKEVYPPQQCVETIVRAGGVAVLAHPNQLQRETQAEVEAIVDELMDYGLQGVEAIHGNVEPDLAAVYDAMARRRGLIVTGGSDFHGASKPNIQLGSGRFGYRIPYQYLEDLKSRHAVK